ncbi:MAG: hypothetical protein EAX96_05775 [Candidatus Lokiarchaeota archaeon]|nr:hypothetical protein [Candidatus Lokiarchaeota archaeon]
MGEFLENELIYQIKKLKYDAVIFSNRIISQRLFCNFFQENKEIRELIASNPTEAISIALGIYLSGKKGILIFSKLAIMNSLGNLNDLKRKEIPIPIFLGEKFNLFAEPITILKIKRVLRGINIPFFVIKKEKNLNKFGDFIQFAETIKAPVVFCVENELWG